MNWTVEPLACSASAVRANRGVSWRHGPHHEAKKLSTTGWWRILAQGVEVDRGPTGQGGQGEVGGGGCRPPTTGPGSEPDPDVGPEPDEQDDGQHGGDDRADQERSQPPGAGDGPSAEGPVVPGSGGPMPIGPAVPAVGSVAPVRPSAGSGGRVGVVSINAW